MNKTVIHQSERLYDFLLKFYPKRYRQEFGAEMKYVFSQSLKDAYKEHGGQGIITLWRRTILDTGKSLFIQHVENQKGGETMRTKKTIAEKNINIARLMLIVGGILLVPLIAMQFTSEVAWSFGDFLIMGILLFGTGLGLEYITKNINNPVYRVIVYFVIVATFLLIWAELAVGIFGTPFAGD